jgi:hypothetical protein
MEPRPLAGQTNDNAKEKRRYQTSVIPNQIKKVDKKMLIKRRGAGKVAPDL